MHSILFQLKSTRIDATKRVITTSLATKQGTSYDDVLRMFKDFFNDDDVPSDLKDVIVQASIEQLLDSDNNNPIALRFADRIHQVMKDNFDLCQEFVNEVNKDAK